MTLSRRQFLHSASGLSFGFVAGPWSAWSAESAGQPPEIAAAGTGAGTASPYAWVHIAPTGTITIQTPSDELGQGSMTALPLILAEELDANWDEVAIEFCPPDDSTYGNPNLAGLVLTVASWAVSSYYDRLRLHGAQMRRILLENAARHWQVPLEELHTEPSLVRHARSRRQLSYGDIAAFAILPQLPPAIAATELKPSSRFRLIGSDLPRRDIPAKCNGSAQYAIDVRLPSLLQACVIRPSLPGARVHAFHPNGVNERVGVVGVVDLEDRIAIVAENAVAALAARSAVTVEWDRASTFTSDEAMEARARHVRDLALAGFPWEQEGDVESAFRTAGQVAAAEYSSDYVYHAQMEPLNGVAWYKAGGELEVWAGTQAPSHCQRAVAAAAGVNPQQVTLHRMYSGGAFGRRGAADHDYVIDAAVLSRRFGRPVKVIWSREDDVRLGRLKPMSAHYLRAAIGGDGRISAWHHRVASEETLIQGDPERYEQWGRIPITAIFGAEQPVYRIPNRKAEHLLQPAEVRVSPLRGVGVTPNRFAGESFLDEIAQMLGQDPLALRLQLVQGNPRATTVLETVAAMAEWARPRTGTALGLAFTPYGETLLACIAEISVDGSTGRISVHNLWSAVDPGLVIQPVNARAQIEGGLLFGLSNALKERVTIRNGEIQQSNYHDYPILRQDEAPAVQIEIIASGDRPSAVGEVGALLPAPAIANALARLTGKRLRHMPFTAERVRDLFRS